MINSRLINTKVAGGGGCTDIVDNYDPFGGGGVALYQLNGNANDVSVNYNGTPTNVTYGTGKFGQAAVFNGSSSWISIPSQVSPSNDNSDFNYSFWLSTVAFTSGSKWVIGETSDTGPVRIGIRAGVSTNNYTFDFLRRYGGSYYGYAPSTEFTMLPSTFYHFSVNYYHSTKLWKFYFNGQEIYSTSTVTYTGAQTAISSVAIGRYGPGNAALHWNGSIDQFRIFNTALLPLEVEALYTEELCICDGTVDTLDILGDGSCIALYPLDGNANDLSGNYSGTPTNVSYGVGEFDLAGVFNGSSSGINLPSSLNTSVIDATGAFSISMWINANDISTIQYLFCSNTANNVDIGINANNQGAGKIVWTIYNTSYSYLISTTTITTNTLYNIIVTYNNGLSELFINGASQGTITKTLVENSIEPTLGYRNTGGSVRFNGEMDQVRIFNKALDQNDVDILFAETACSINCAGSDLTDYYFNGVQTSSLTCLFDFYMSPDGTKMYTIKGYGNTVSQYTLNTPYSVSSSTFVRDRTSTNTTPIVGLQFKPDGTKMYVYSNSGVAALQEFTLSTAWDISTASLTTTINTSGQVSAGNGLGLFIKPDGTKFYVTSVSTKRIYQYSMGSAWTLSGASYDSIQSPVFTELIRSPHITNDGSKLFCGINGAYQYDLITDWDITTLVYKETLTSSPYSDCITLHLNDDEDKMYILNAENSIYELELTCTPN